MLRVGKIAKTQRIDVAKESGQMRFNLQHFASILIITETGRLTVEYP